MQVYADSRDALLEGREEFQDKQATDLEKCREEFSLRS